MTQVINYTRTKMACYLTYPSMACVFSLPPILFVPLRDMYGISYTLLGSLVLINFFTQLTIDLIFTMFSKHFNTHKTLTVMPLLTSLGLLLYALIPSFFPQQAYLGLVIGTIVFSVAAGLCEVLLSPVVAAIPSEHIDKDLSMLHSLYAWGVFGIVIISTVFFNIFGREKWMYLTIFLAVFPFVVSYLFATSPVPEMNFSHGKNEKGVKSRNSGLALCVMCIFLGSCAENTMSNWISGFMENALLIPKTVGDIFGMALFALLLGLTRMWYAKRGRDITNFLLGSMIGAMACYVTAGLCRNVIISFIACVLTGCFTSMLWPGTLILMEEKMPKLGVAAYALMATGGDFGASVAPQLMGIVVDKVSASSWATQFGAAMSLSPEQLGMKVGMLTASVFPLLGIMILLYIKRYFAKR